MKIENATFKKIEKAFWNGILPVYADCRTYLVFLDNLDEFFIVEGFHHKKKRAGFGCERFKIGMFNIIFLISFFGDNRFTDKSFGNQVFYTVIQVT